MQTDLTREVADLISKQHDLARDVLQILAGVQALQAKAGKASAFACA